MTSSYFSKIYTTILCILISLHVVSAIAGQAAAADSSSSSAASAVDLKRCPDLRIALINGVPFHYEVLVGLLHVLRPYAQHTDVYLNRYTRASNADGAWDLFKWSKSNFFLLTRSTLARQKQKGQRYDLVVLVSTDYELDANLELLRAMRPRTIVAMVHNSDFRNISRLFTLTYPPMGPADAIPAASGGDAAPVVKLITLAPHVARTLASSTGHPVSWLLATYPFKPRTDCLTAPDTDLLGRCLRGFSMQGKFSNLRRNYTAIWDQLTARLPELSSGDLGRLFHLSILGKGPNRLGMPAELEPHVSLLRRLHYRAFYEAIHHTFALVPALASEKYYSHKFSSTIISSLTAGTPMIADAKFLATYSMFGPDSAYEQRQGEAEVDVMVRLMRMKADGLLDVRRGLVALRRKLNGEAAAWYGELIAGLCGRVGAAGGGVSGAA